MKSVEDLDVFKLAHELALKVYKITAKFPKEESFNLVSQMRRAATSVGSNLVVRIDAPQ
jgi:four helix bundle protein